jgi:Raf kinase inhibitor-like YbhB/YbcL family protein
MYGKLIKILLLAFVAAALVTFLALSLMKKDAPAPQQAALVPPVGTTATPQKNPHRDMLEDTVVTTTPAVTPPAQQPPAQPQQTTGAAKRPMLQYGALAGTLRIISTDIQANGRIPRDYTCNGSNISPAFQWTGAPRSALAYVILFEKLDAVEGNSLQWGVYNIPSSQTSVPARLPREPVLGQGVTQAINDAGSVGYIGPCAPRGQFQYTLSVIALDQALALPAGLKRDDLIKAINGHIVDMAVLPLVHFYRL